MKAFVGGLVVMVGLGVAAPASGAQPELTCAAQYLVCLNNVPQSGDWFTETMEEQRCTGRYLACLARQATQA